VYNSGNAVLPVDSSMVTTTFHNTRMLPTYSGSKNKPSNKSA
jgi:hypothetical protein